MRFWANFSRHISAWEGRGHIRHFFFTETATLALKTNLLPCEKQNRHKRIAACMHGCANCVGGGEATFVLMRKEDSAVCASEWEESCCRLEKQPSNPQREVYRRAAVKHGQIGHCSHTTRGPVNPENQGREVFVWD